MKSGFSSTSFCLKARMIANGLVIGVGVGLATNSLAIGLALGLAFAVIFSRRET